MRTTRYKVSAKVDLGPDPVERRQEKQALRTADIPHCLECLTTTLPANDQWIHVDCAGIDRFCSWECLFVWCAWFMADSDGDPRVKVKRLKDRP